MVGVRFSPSCALYLLEVGRRNDARQAIEQVEATLVRRLKAYLERSRNNPELVFET